MAEHMALKYHFGAMKVSIDRAGRIISPAALRKKLGLEAGSELELSVDDLGLRLTRSVPGPTVERASGRRVVRPTVARKHLPELDVAALIQEERQRWPV
jgi:AbrB family looped-hinge helix DNA binding protein